MFNSKYGDILTMILVILIVAIVGILGYFTYSFLAAKTINSNANSKLEEFKQATSIVNKDTSNIDSDEEEEENNVVTNTVNPNEIFEKLNQNNAQQGQTIQNNQEPQKVMMEDYEVMGSIRIPKTGIELPILDKTTKRSLELSVTIAYGPGLNEPGNTIIFGHNYRNGLFFSNNRNLSNGDKIYITDKYNNTVTYVIYDIFETTQDDARYMERYVEEGVREISLQTCTDDSSGRIIVCAKEE